MTIILMILFEWYCPFLGLGQILRRRIIINEIYLVRVFRYVFELYRHLFIFFMYFSRCVKDAWVFVWFIVWFFPFFSFFDSIFFLFDLKSPYFLSVHVAIKSLLVRNMSDYSWYLINSLFYYSTLISLKLVVSLLHATTQYQLYILDFHLTSLWLQYSNKQGLIYCILSSPVSNALHYN